MKQLSVRIFGLILLSLVAWRVGKSLAFVPSSRILPGFRESPPLIHTPVPTPLPEPPHTPLRVPILMYHYVEVVTDPKDTIRKSLDILPKTFEAQISTLLENGYTPIFMNELADALDGIGALPSKPIILTFDDGYRDFYTDVYPILQRHHVKATTYVISSFVGLNKNYMTAAQIEEIAKSPYIEVGAHTVNHRNLKGMQPSFQRVEIEQSRHDLEAMTNQKVTDFAYPYGLYDTSAELEVAAAGFRTAVTTQPGIHHMPNQRFVLTRLRPAGRTGGNLITWLAGLSQ